MKNLRLLLSGVLTLTILGCRDCGTMTSGAKPDIVPNPTALSFNACPSRDENGGVVNGVFPDKKKLAISNRGKVATQLRYVLSGAGSASFFLGSPDGGEIPGDIGSLDDVELPITFAPTTKGDVRADLTIDDFTSDTENAVVTLIGTGVNLPSQPFLETAPQKRDLSGFVSCTADTPLSDCTLDFPDTLMDQSAWRGATGVHRTWCRHCHWRGVQLRASDGGRGDQDLGRQLQERAPDHDRL